MNLWLKLTVVVESSATFTTSDGERFMTFSLQHLEKISTGMWYTWFSNATAKHFSKYHYQQDRYKSTKINMIKRD